MKRSAMISPAVVVALACASPGDDAGDESTASAGSESDEGTDDGGDGDGDGDGWTDPISIDQNVYLANALANYETLAVDSDGNVVAMWLAASLSGGSYRWSVWANRYDANTGEWGAAELIETDDIGEAYPYMPAQVVMDPDGNAFAVWATETVDPITAEPTVSTSFNRYDRASGQWGIGARTHPGYVGSETWPHLIALASGPPMLIWSRGVLWASTFDEVNGRWRNGEAITSEPGAPHEPSGIQLAGGDSLLVWQQRGIPIDEATVRSIRLDQASGQWVDSMSLEPTFLVNINLPVTDPSVAAAGNGDAFAVWHADLGAGARVRAAKFDGGSMNWGSIATLDPGSTAAYDPRVAVSQEGEALAVWSDEEATLHWSLFDPGLGSWSSADTLAASAPGPEVAINHAGVAVVSWASEGTVAWDAWSQSMSLGDGTWSPAQLLESSDFDAWQPRLFSMGPSFWAIWKTQEVDRFRIWVSHRP